MWIALLDFNQSKLNAVLIPLSLASLIGLQWTTSMKSYISHQGCYYMSFLTDFLINYTQCHSFTITMFRYVCIAHPYKISSLGQNSPQVSIFQKIPGVYRRPKPSAEAEDFNPLASASAAEVLWPKVWPKVNV